MSFLLQLPRGLLAVALAASLAACGSDTGSPPAANAAAPGQVVANDCRSPNAQTTQRGCRSASRMLATQ